MSEYENVVGGKLRLKGKSLDVKTGGISKKKRRKKKHHYHYQSTTARYNESSTDHVEDTNEIDKDEDKDKAAKYDDHLTPAERRYLQQWEKIDLQRLTKMAGKSQRDRIQEFNQYLANLKSQRLLSSSVQLV